MSLLLWSTPFSGLGLSFIRLASCRPGSRWRLEFWCVAPLRLGDGHSRCEAVPLLRRLLRPRGCLVDGLSDALRRGRFCS